MVHKAVHFSLQLQTLDGTFHFVAKSDLEGLEYSSQLMSSDYGSTRSPNELDDVVRLTLAQRPNEERISLLAPTAQRDYLRGRAGGQTYR